MIVFKLFSIITFLGNFAKNHFAERSVWEGVLSVFRIDMVPEYLVHWEKILTWLLDLMLQSRVVCCLRYFWPWDSVFRRFPKLRKATISFVMSLCLSIRQSAWNNAAAIGRIFMKFDIWIFFEKYAGKIQVPIKYDRNNRYFTWRPMHVFIVSHSILFRMRNVLYWF
jgi:hypothetical protein